MVIINRYGIWNNKGGVGKVRLLFICQENKNTPNSIHQKLLGGT